MALRLKGEVQQATKELTVLNDLGLHARPAAQFVRCVQRYRSYTGFVHQTLTNQSPIAFVFVPMVGAERDEPFAFFRLRTDHHGERNQMIAPDAIVLERDPIVAPAGGIEVELLRPNDHARHRMQFR